MGDPSLDNVKVEEKIVYTRDFDLNLITIQNDAENILSPSFSLCLYNDEEIAEYLKFKSSQNSMTLNGVSINQSGEYQVSDQCITITPSGIPPELEIAELSVTFTDEIYELNLQNQIPDLNHGIKLVLGEVPTENNNSAVQNDNSVSSSDGDNISIEKTLFFDNPKLYSNNDGVPYLEIYPLRNHYQNPVNNISDLYFNFNDYDLHIVSEEIDDDFIDYMGDPDYPVTRIKINLDDMMEDFNNSADKAYHDSEDLSIFISDGPTESRGPKESELNFYPNLSSNSFEFDDSRQLI